MKHSKTVLCLLALAWTGLGHSQTGHEHDGWALLRLGDLDAAQAAFELSIDSPDAPMNRLGLAFTVAAEGDWSMAANLADGLVAPDSSPLGHAWGHLVLGYAALDAADPIAARAQFNLAAKGFGGLAHEPGALQARLGLMATDLFADEPLSPQDNMLALLAVERVPAAKSQLAVLMAWSAWRDEMDNEALALLADGLALAVRYGETLRAGHLRLFLAPILENEMEGAIAAKTYVEWLDLALVPCLVADPSQKSGLAEAYAIGRSQIRIGILNPPPPTGPDPSDDGGDSGVGSPKTAWPTHLGNFWNLQKPDFIVGSNLRIGIDDPPPPTGPDPSDDGGANGCGCGSGGS